MSSGNYRAVSQCSAQAFRAQQQQPEPRWQNPPRLRAPQPSHIGESKEELTALDKPA